MAQINVHIGEVKVARRGEVLAAILGSCVGIGFLWREQSLCGLAHCLLPQSPSKTFIMSARYVDQAVVSLLALMKIPEQRRGEILVICAGGGNMSQPNATKDEDLIGVQNYQAVLKALELHGLRLHHSDHGGNEGRKVTIHSADYRFVIEKIPRILMQGKKYA